MERRRIFNPVAGEMVRQARVLAQATSDLVNAMRSDAEAEIDMENSKKLLAAAKLLADSTARMVEAAKVPQNPTCTVWLSRKAHCWCLLFLGGGRQGDKMKSVLGQRRLPRNVKAGMGLSPPSFVFAICPHRELLPTRTMRTSSSGCGKRPKGSGWPPTQLPRTPLRRRL